MKKFYTKQDIQELKSIDVFTYMMNVEPDNLIKVSSKSYCTKEHDSMRIDPNGWNWFSKGIGGRSAYSYLEIVKELDFKTIMDLLHNLSINEEKVSFNVLELNKKKDFILPEKSVNNKKIIKYLLSRGIDYDIIIECINKELLYEDINHNVVFVGYDKEHNPRYAFKRASNDTRFMQEVEGSHKDFSFSLKSNINNSSVNIFESAIDLLSYATLLKLDGKEWYNENLLSLGGVYAPLKNEEYKALPIALNLYLNNNPNTKKVVLHLDNDSAGRGSTNALIKQLENRYEVVDDAVIYGKDVNDFLCKKQGINRKKKLERER